jgi:hypothetical protein
VFHWLVREFKIKNREENLFVYFFRISFRIVGIPIAFHLISSQCISFHLISSQCISFHLISSHFISFHLISSHFISFHLIFSSLIFTLKFFQSIAALCQSTWTSTALYLDDKANHYHLHSHEQASLSPSTSIL